MTSIKIAQDSNHGSQLLPTNTNQKFTLCSVQWFNEMEYRCFRIDSQYDAIRCYGDVYRDAAFTRKA